VPSGYYYPANAKAEVAQYFGDVTADSWKTSNVYGALTQYCQGVATGSSSCASASNSFSSYSVSYDGSATVTTSFPSSGCANYTLGSGTNSKVCLIDSQLQSEIKSVVASKGWKTGLGTEFFLFTPPLVGECFDASEVSCYDPELSFGILRLPLEHRQPADAVRVPAVGRHHRVRVPVAPERRLSERRLPIRS
jgi:hypothetical protein